MIYKGHFGILQPAISKNFGSGFGEGFLNELANVEIAPKWGGGLK